MTEHVTVILAADQYKTAADNNWAQGAIMLGTDGPHAVSVQAVHGQSAQAFAFSTDFGGGANRDIVVTFTNDLYGGTAETDRNLWLLGTHVNGQWIAPPAANGMMSGGASITVVAPPPKVVAPPAPPAKTLLHITDWSGFRQTSNGDASSWANSIPPGGNRTLNGGAEDEYYTDPTIGQYDPFSIDPETKALIITATPQPINGKGYSSGCLTSAGFFNFTYGTVSIKAKLIGSVSLQGLWPALWMLASNLKYDGENDIMEMFSNSGDVQQTLHGAINGVWPASSPHVDLPIDITQWHTYETKWAEDFVTEYIDGVQTAQWPTPDGMKEPYFLLLNLAIFAKGTWAPAPEPGNVGKFYIGEVLVTQP